MLDVQKVGIAAIWEKKSFPLTKSEKIKPHGNSTAMGNDGNILFFFSQMLSVKMFCGFMGEKAAFFFSPEDTVKLLGLQCSSGQESPSQNMSISSRFVF